MRALVGALLVALPLLVHAQAEPAPESYVPPGRATPPPPSSRAGDPRPPERPPRWHLVIDPRLCVQLGGLASGGLPRLGYGAGIAAGRALVDLGRMRLGVGAAFSYQRFAHDRPSLAGGLGTEALAHMTFAARLFVDGLFGRLRPWAAAGAGLSVGTYQTPPSGAEPMGISDTAALALVELAVGLAVRIYEGIELGLHGGLDLTFAGHPVGTSGLLPYGPGTFSAGLDIGFRF